MSATPLTDFLATLADPLALEKFRADPFGAVRRAKLSPELAQLVLEGHPGAIRIRAVQELERAGLSPLVSDKFSSPGSSNQQPMNISMNSFTSSTFTANTSTSTTYNTNTDTFITTTSDQTTTTTHNDGFPNDRSILDIIDQSISYFETR